MIIINNYSLREDDSGKSYVRSYEVNICPICGHSVVVIGSRERKYIKDDGIKAILIIRRLRCTCTDCRVIHHELPDILVPYKRHCAKTIENIISGDVADVCCDDREIEKIKTWWESCRTYFEGVLNSLREKYGDVLPPHPAPKEIIRAVANANLWIHTRSALLSG